MAIRPALLSRMMSSSERVQKFPRAQTSPWAYESPDAHGLENAPADGKLEWIVTEQGKMAGTASRGYSRVHHVDEAKLAFCGKAVQVRGISGFELGFSVRAGKSADSVHDEEYHFFSVVAGESPQKFHSFHGSDSTSG